MDDEGYTSPSEEDANENEPKEIYSNDYIPWEEISTLPDIPNRHLHWECMKTPFPCRRDFRPNRTSGKLALSYCSDDKTTSAQLVDQVWRVSRNYFERTSYGGGDFDGFENSRVSSTSFVEELKSLGLKPIYIPLKHFIQHSLHLLVGRESPSFSSIPETVPEILFQKNLNVLVPGFSPGILQNFARPIIRSGSLCKKLWNIINTSREVDFKKPKNSASETSVFNAFLKFVENYLVLQQTILMLKTPLLGTLTELLDFIKPFIHQIEVLNQILRVQIRDGSIDLLAELNQLMFTEDTLFTSDLIRNLFLTCSSSYLRYISDWVFRGDLPSSSEFHIIRASDRTFEDRRSWTKQFIQKERIPMFLEDSEALIFETGKAIHLLSAIQVEFSKICSSTLFSSESEILMEPVLSFDGIEKLRSNWNLRLSCFSEENSHLVDSVHDAIEEVISLSSTSKPDETVVKVVEESRAERQLQEAARARDILEKKREDQRSLRRSLDEQILQAKKIKAKRKIDDEAEDVKIAEFVQQKYNEDLEAKRQLAVKYNYTRVCDNEPSKPKQMNGVFSHEEPKKLLSSASTSPHKLSAIPAPLLNNQEIYHEVTRQLCDNLSTHEDSTDSTNVNEIAYQSEAPEDAQEVKFDPDKVLVRNPPPYKLTFLTDKPPIIGSDESTSPTEHSTTNLNWDPPCINYFISESIVIPLHAQNRMVNTALLHHIIVEKQLYHHLFAVNSFLCLQNGLFSRFLNELLIEEVIREGIDCRDDLKQRFGRFNSILAEALTIAMETENNPFVKNLTFVLAREHDKILEDLDAPTNKKACSTFQLLNLLRLNYSVVWPLNIILTDEMFILYEKLFGFLMQLSRAEGLLERVFRLLKCKSANSTQLHRLHNIRFQFLHFVRSFRNYVNVTVIHSAWDELCQNLHKLDSIEKIYDYLVTHVKSMVQSCLLGQKAERLMKLLSSHLRVVESFCSRIETACRDYNVDWSKGDELPKDVFQELYFKFSAAEQLRKIFMASAHKLTQKGVYPKVAFFLEQYNFKDLQEPESDTNGIA